jgi:hypothetical protein
MAVLIDGVDKVCPFCTEEIIQLLELLFEKQNQGNLGVSKSNRGQIKQEFECQLFKLVPLSDEGQKSCLINFCNRKYLDPKGDYLKDLANGVVELSFRYLSDGEKKFMAGPLQGTLVAMIFKEDLKKCSASTSVELPEYINHVGLCDLYLNRKWDIYLSEKKFPNRT